MEELRSALAMVAIATELEREKMGDDHFWWVFGL
jgi:hypothetical protein